MVKTVISAFILACGGSAFPLTCGYIAPDRSYGLVNLQTQRPQIPSNDAKVLYDSIDVAPQLIYGGWYKKSLQSGDNTFLITCYYTPQTNRSLCQIQVDNRPAPALLDPNRKVIEYTANGNVAWKLWKSFNSKKNNKFDFQTSDRTVEIVSTPNEFTFTYKSANPKLICEK